MRAAPLCSTLASEHQSRVRVRTFRRSEWSTYRDLRLRALEDAPDAFGTTLAEASEHSDQHWKSRLRNAAEAVDLPLVGEVDGVPQGLAWGRIEPGQRIEAHLYQMWVAPQGRRLGVGRALLAAVVDWARAQRLRCLVLDVTCGNTPARNLYAGAGFREAGDPEPLRPDSEQLAQTMVLRLDAES